MMLKSSSISASAAESERLYRSDYLDDFLSIRFCWLRYGWLRTTLFRVSKRRYCKSGNGGNQL